MVLGTVFTIEMVARVGISPVAGAVADRVPRRAMLVALDLARALAALALPFVTEVWQVCVPVFLLQSVPASFTPTFQATLADVLPEEDRYSRELSLSRLAQDRETILSPVLAAAAPAVVGHDALFVGAAIGFLASAAAALPRLLDRGARPPPDAVRGRRDDLPGEHPRIRGGRAHAHPCVIEAQHAQWPHDAW